MSESMKRIRYYADYLAKHPGDAVLLAVLMVLVFNIGMAAVWFFATGQYETVALFLGFGATFALYSVYVELVHIRTILQRMLARSDVQK